MSLPTDPTTRIERYLARIAGQNNVSIPDDPTTRIECYLDYIARNGGFIPAPSAGGHNAIFRGMSLGGAITSAQSQAIMNGSFDDLFVGDYWTIESRIYRIAGFDLYMNVGSGDDRLATHHAVIVPDTHMATDVMNDTAITTGGYAGSSMKTIGLTSVITTLQNIFGDHLVEHPTLLSTGVGANGIPTSAAWSLTLADLMSESQVYGRGMWGTQAQNAYNVGERYSRFPLFDLCPEYIINMTSWYWLSDIRNNTQYSYVAVDGTCQVNGANVRGGIRPYFLIA